MVKTAIGFTIEVVDGEGFPVNGVEVGVRFRYLTAPTTWSSAISDSDGRAVFDDEHPEPPTEICVYVNDLPCATFPVGNGHTFVLEL